MAIQSKHFLNDPASLVIESLEGLCAVNPHLSLDSTNKVVYLTSRPNQVALISGGGSGHEPAHAGFVGDGILTGAVCGNVFASPSSTQVGRGIDLVDNEHGTVIFVKNYTGDVLNFGLAKEKYAALHPDKSQRVKFVIVGDDVAVGKAQGSIVGLAGTCLVYKIAGALARKGASLDEVYNTAQWISSRLATIGVGLEHCHVPGTATNESHLSSTEIEIGMGIHNESGFQRLSPAPPLKDLIPKLLGMLTSTTDPDRSFVPFQGEAKDDVVVLVNNLGGLSELELGGIVGQVKKDLDAININVKRILSGTFMTSLNMPGFSLTLLLLPSGNEAPISSDAILSLLDEGTDAPGWKWSSKTTPAVSQAANLAPLSSRVTQNKIPLAASEPNQFIDAVTRACKALIAAEPEITQMDNIAGDGDCGLTLKAGASGVLKKVDDGTISGQDVVQSAIAISEVAEEAMGGTSGALYSIFFSALAQGLEAAASGETPGTASPEIWRTALNSALDKLYTYTRARPPSRTLVDPLAAFIQTLQKGTIVSAIQAGTQAAESTRNIDAKAGRSAYVEGDRLKDEHVADPGAWGVKIILEGLQG